MTNSCAMLILNFSQVVTGCPRDKVNRAAFDYPSNLVGLLPRVLRPTFERLTLVLPAQKPER